MIGQTVDLEITEVGFGGEFIGFTAPTASTDDAGGETVFVRGAILGERVRAQITHRRKRGYLARILELLEPAPTRRRHPWPLGGVDLTGAANYGHIEPAAQHEMKGHMLARELRLAGGADLVAQVSDAALRGAGAAAGRSSAGHSGVVIPVHAIEYPAGVAPGWRYRTRIGVDKLHSGVGMYVRSREAHERVYDLPLASSRAEALDLFGAAWDGGVAAGTHLRVVTPRGSEPVVIAGDTVYRAPGVSADPYIRELVRYRGAQFSYVLRADGFWQVHENAPDALVASVFDLLAVEEGNRVVDLYAGAGLFALVAAELVGPRGFVRAYEANPAAAQAAAANFAKHNTSGCPWARAQAVTIDARTIGDLTSDADIVIADPPRAGLGEAGATVLAQSPANQIALVSCDAVSMARDLAALVRAGRRVRSFHALDIFPNTHFVETVCVLA